MKPQRIMSAATLLAALTACSQPQATESPTRWVDPRIGTGGHRHVARRTASVPRSAK